MSIIFSSIEEIKAYEKAETQRRGKQAYIARYANDVVDCTEFVFDHPGRRDLITEHAGGSDLKTEYDDLGHSAEADAILKSLKIGDLKPSATEKTPNAASAAVPALLAPAPPAPKAEQKSTEKTDKGTNYAAIVVVAAGIALA